MGAMRWRQLVPVLCIASLATTLDSAQPGGRRVALSGTVVAVNQQSDSVTLIDLQRMERAGDRASIRGRA